MPASTGANLENSQRSRNPGIIAHFRTSGASLCAHTWVGRGEEMMEKSILHPEGGMGIENLHAGQTEEVQRILWGC